MSYIQYTVAPILRPWIRYFWSYDVQSNICTTLHIRSFADKYPRLIFQDIREYKAITEPGGTTKALCYISGIDTKPSDAFWESRFSHFGISFEPHALHNLFGISATELTNQTPDINFLDKTDIPDLLLAATSHLKRVEILTTYFTKKLYDYKKDHIINDLFKKQWFHHFDEQRSLKKIADYYNISERQLQRRFKQNVGIPAGKFARIHRFEKALYLLSESKYGELTDISYSLGYSDQAHFIKDFRQFSGYSPYEFVQRESIGAESASYIYFKENHP